MSCGPRILRVSHGRDARATIIRTQVILIFFTAFGTVFVAEIVGDKLLYTTGVLAARYRTLPIMLGMAIAFMAKMGVAVLVGEAISKLPGPLVATITAISFLGVACVRAVAKIGSPAKFRQEASRVKGRHGFVRGDFLF